LEKIKKKRDMVKVCKKILIVFICFISLFNNHVFAQEEERTDLELSTDNLGNKNEESLTDSNHIPVFTNDFKIKDENDAFEMNSLFNGSKSPIKKKKDVDVQEEKLFTTPIIINKSFKAQTTGWETYIGYGIVLIMGLSIFIAVLISRSKIKKQRGMKSDFNI